MHPTHTLIPTCKNLNNLRHARRFKTWQGPALYRLWPVARRVASIGCLPPPGQLRWFVVNACTNV